MAREGQCKIEGCKRPFRAKGYCRTHYRKWRRGEYGHNRYKTCTAENCRKPRFQKSYCEEHFNGLFLKKPVGEIAS